MVVNLTLFLVALILGLIAAVLGRPKPPALDAGRLFSVCQSALLWGQAEEGDDAVAVWTERVTAALLYNPAGRQGWAKLDDPAGYEIPVPSHPSERALVEALRGLEPGSARFERFFADDSARSALLDDPHALGDDYDPGRWLGHGCDWEALARWAEPVQAAIGRRFEHHHLVVMAAQDALEAAGALRGALAAHASSVLLSTQGCEPSPSQGEALAVRLRELVKTPADRLVLLVLGDAGPLALEALRCDPVLRDRVVAVLLDGCPMGGVVRDPPAGLAVEERAAWLGEHFTQSALDTEIRRSTPYCVLARLEPGAIPPGDGRTPWGHQRVEEPPTPASGRRPIAVVELGAAPADRGLLDPGVFARGLLLVLAFLLGDGAPRA